MADVRVSSRAERDLEDIRDWGVREFGPDVAFGHLEAIGNLIALLGDHPLAGEARPRWGQAIRSISRRPHRVLYRVDGSGVLIVRIVHASRDVRRALRARK